MPEIWPFVPHPEITERLSWFTDVRRTPDGEVRESLRDARRTMTYRFEGSRSFWHSQSIIRTDPTQVWEVPIWTEATKVSSINATDTSISVNLNADYGDRAIIFGGRDNYVLVDVSGVSATLDLAAPVGQSFANATVAPLKLATVPAGIETRKGLGRFVGVDITFHIQDAETLGATNYPQYMGLDFFPCSARSVRSMQGRVSQLIGRVDNEMGPVELIALRNIPDNQMMIDWSKTDDAEKWSFKQWLHTIRGRDRPFWVVDWSGTLTPASAIAALDTSILIEPLLRDPSEYIGRHVYFGNGEFREVTQAVDEGGQHRLTIAALTEAPTNKPALIQKVRFDSDVVELFHTRGFHSRASIPILEVAA